MSNGNYNRGKEHRLTHSVSQSASSFVQVVPNGPRISRERAVARNVPPPQAAPLQVT